jgi:hypothetical protein
MRHPQDTEETGAAAAAAAAAKTGLEVLAKVFAAAMLRELVCLLLQWQQVAADDIMLLSCLVYCCK